MNSFIKYLKGLAEEERIKAEELAKKLAAEEAERQRIALEKRLAEEQRQREEEAKRLDEEQPDVEYRMKEMKDKTKFAAKVRFDHDMVSSRKEANCSRPSIRRQILYLMSTKKLSYRLSSLCGRIRKIKSLSRQLNVAKWLRRSSKICKQ